MLGFLRKLLGNRGEWAAARYLKSQGFRIVARQWLGRFSEFDLIAMDGETIVFVEVKTLRSGSRSHPTENVTREKQARLTRQALVYLKRRRLLERRARFDVVAVVWPDEAREPIIEHYRNAFEPIGPKSMFA